MPSNEASLLWYGKQKKKMLNVESKNLSNAFVANIQQSDQPPICDNLRITQLRDKLNVPSINDTPKGSHEYAFKINFVKILSNQVPNIFIELIGKSIQPKVFCISHLNKASLWSFRERGLSHSTLSLVRKIKAIIDRQASKSFSFWGVALTKKQRSNGNGKLQ